MRVLQVNTVFRRGSTGRIAFDLHNTLIANDHKSIVAYGRGARISEHYKFSSMLSVLSDVIATRLLDRHGLGSRIVTNRLIRFIDRWKPDIIHVHNIHGYYVNYYKLFQYLAEKDIPVVWTLHDCWPFTGHCANFDYIGCMKWRATCFHCPQKCEYPKSMFIDASEANYILKQKCFRGVRSLSLVAPSQWLAGLVRQSFFGNRQVEVINNGIDLECFKPTSRRFRSKHELGEKFILLGAAGVWTERKGLDYLITAIDKLPFECVLVIVGKLKKAIQKSSRIIYIPHTDSAEEMADLFSSVDVFVNPTLEDNFPTVNLESLACGTPVITFNSGGSAETISETTGIVVPKANQEALIDAILNVKKRGRESYANACRALAVEKYSKVDRYSDYLSLYHSVLSRLHR